MKVYHRLCLLEREIISLLFHSGTGIREIGRYLGRSPSTISREIQRNKTGFYYVPATANNKARRRCCHQVRKLYKDPRLRHRVLTYLRQQWVTGANQCQTEERLS
jgi:IS30 family transposase